MGEDGDAGVSCEAGCSGDVCMRARTVSMSQWPPLMTWGAQLPRQVSLWRTRWSDPNNAKNGVYHNAKKNMVQSPQA